VVRDSGIGSRGLFWGGKSGVGRLCCRCYNRKVLFATLWGIVTRSDRTALATIRKTFFSLLGQETMARDPLIIATHDVWLRFRASAYGRNDHSGGQSKERKQEDREPHG
jgi:hypothetical protein